MQHYIIVKYNDKVIDREGLLREVSSLFDQALHMDGIHSVTVRPAVLLSDIRYDLMICMEMEQEALAIFDASLIHSQWKQMYSGYIQHKVIFDCES